MKNKINEQFYGICVKHKDGPTGWIVGPNTDILKFPTENEAEQWLTKAKENPNYSWNCDVSVKLFNGYAFQY